jgi:hypothetical protein
MTGKSLPRARFLAALIVALGVIGGKVVAAGPASLSSFPPNQAALCASPDGSAIFDATRPTGQTVFVWGGETGPSGAFAVPSTPAEMIEDLIQKVNGLIIHRGVKAALLAVLNSALTSANNDNENIAALKMSLFINLVGTFSPNFIPARTAADLIDDADAIIAVLIG